jgi:hypothetical protein
MLTEPERRPGRRALEPGSKSTPIPVRFGPSAHDRICREAAQKGMRVTEFIRWKVTGDEDDD